LRMLGVVIVIGRSRVVRRPRVHSALHTSLRGRFLWRMLA
jgi:hypothetical protein